MDYKKDIKNITAISKTSSSIASSFGTSVSKKCERLATAIYLVTNFLSDNEPMKFRLRELSIDLVREASFAKNGSKSLEVNVLENLQVGILDSMSLLELALVAGLVSEMNFTILKREYSALRDVIEIRKSSRDSRTDDVFGKNFFGVPEPKTDIGDFVKSGRVAKLDTLDNLVGQSSALAPKLTFAKGHPIGQTVNVMSDRNISTKSETINYGPKLGTLYTHSSAPRAITDVAKESRRSRILKLVKDNIEVTIKDIASHFPDLSEKTIQRELAALVEDGVLKKFGDRRWSRYKII